MNAVGIITEYNPLHEGHIHHISKAKELTNADCIICVMSGDFVQRGEPAIFNKYTRTRAALKAGVNLVVELPVRYSTSSSEGFAYGSTAILDKLGANSVVFGSECGDINILMSIAILLANESENYRQYLSEQLKKGASFPVARTQAICSILNKDYENILKSPNNILAIEYIKSIIKNNLSITPLTIKRSIDNYNSTSLDEMPSASAIREFIKNNTFEKEYICKELLNYTDISDFTPVFMEDFSSIINFKLGELLHLNKNLTSYADINDTLANKLINNFNYNNSIEDFITKCKSKDFTYLRIQRSLMHILLEITENTTDTIEYIRILGFDPIGQEYLSSIKKSIEVPLITKPSNCKKILRNIALEHLKQDIYSTNLYNYILGNKYNIPIENDYTKGPVRI